MNNEAVWIPLMDYAMQTGVSLSTLRRHIKANKIEFKVDQGRYLLKAPAGVTPAAAAPQVAPVVTAPTVARPQPAAGANSAASEVAELRRRLQCAQEEIAELKMLVAIYEDQQAQPKAPARPNTLRMT
jgi:hypothetical protein